MLLDDRPDNLERTHLFLSNACACRSAWTCACARGVALPLTKKTIIAVGSLQFLFRVCRRSLQHVMAVVVKSILRLGTKTADGREYTLFLALHHLNKILEGPAIVPI